MASILNEHGPPWYPTRAMGEMYVEPEYYFERGEGRTHAEWFGRGSEILGLTPKEPVTSALFERLRDGVGPNGEALRGTGGRKAEGKPRTGVDWILAPPKSASIVALVLRDPG